MGESRGYCIAARPFNNGPTLLYGLSVNTSLQEHISYIGLGQANKQKKKLVTKSQNAIKKIFPYTEANLQHAGRFSSPVKLL